MKRPEPNTIVTAKFFYSQLDKVEYSKVKYGMWYMMEYEGELWAIRKEKGSDLLWCRISDEKEFEMVAHTRMIKFYVESICTGN